MKTIKSCVTAMLVALSATACSSRIDGHALSSAPSITPLATSTPTQRPRPGSLSALLSDVAMRRQDVPGTARIVLIPGGDDVAGQVTLDECGQHFPTERLRVARHQIDSVDTSGHMTLSNENVVYRTAAGASQALRELRTAIATCPPNEFVPSILTNQPPIRSRFTAIPAHSTASLLPNRVAVRMDIATQTAPSQTSYAIYQRRGRILVVVYGREPIRTLEEARILARRLSALPIAFVK
jgi:hypothetical protein